MRGLSRSLGSGWGDSKHLVKYKSLLYNIERTKDSHPVHTLVAFEQLRKSNAFDAEYWSARDLQLVLGYAQWRQFEDAIKRAMTSCEESGNDSGNHFANAGKPIPGGKGAVQVVVDFQLSRFACYLIAQIGDPRKPAIANAQKYFAVQTRRQELSDQMTADVERLELRKQTKDGFKQLSGAARSAGVQDRMFGIFHDAGYKGLYGGMGVDAIRSHKDIPVQDSILCGH
jgi:DNA-damage-inducible protein D